MVTNYEVARIFLEMAEGLEMRGQDPYRVRAYQTAARTILALDESLADIRAQGRLRELQGIGESLEAKITEVLDTGHLRAHDELMAEFPPGVAAMMRVPGIGPRTAERLYHELGIDSVEALEHAAQEGRIRALKGLGPKTEENILQAIARVRRYRSRIPLARAYPIAQQIIAALQRAAPVRDIAAAGSLRRMNEDIGDIDILTTSDDPRAVMAAVTRLPMTAQVLATGGTKTSVVTSEGLQVDVRVVEPENFGAALQYFTGSKAHNVKLRTLAVRMGYKLSEYGIFRVSDGARLGGRDEEEMYRPLGIAMFPPELREDRGEIEAGLEGRVPRFVETDDIRGDLHAHTVASDGQADIRTMALAARERGLSYLAITDHSAGRGIAHGLTPERLRRHVREVRRISAQLDDITLLAGAEVDIRRDGTLDYPDDLLAELDICVASVHSAFGLPEAEQTARLLRALANPYLDILAHPTGRVIGARDPINLNMRALIRAAADAGVALEVNAWPERLDLSDRHVLLAREAGVDLVIDTDAHAPEHFDNLFYGVATARRGWALPTDVRNTLPLPQFLARLRRNRLRRAA